MAANKALAEQVAAMRATACTNKAGGSHYRIRTDNGDRWVATSCGDRVVRAAPTGPVAAGYVLALSLQPAFCESTAGRGKIECATQTADRYDASHLSLHGLWPQPRDNVHCGVAAADLDNDRSSTTWERLPAVELSPETRRRLDRVMPGTRSGLDRHEWIKHGTCYAGTQEAYFAASVRLVDEINATAVPTLFAAHVGREIEADAIRAAFDAAFGPGAGERVTVGCHSDGDRRLIRELLIGLAGTISPGTRIGDLMRAAPPRPDGCPGGIVDPVGLQ